MSARAKSTLLIFVAAIGLILTVRLYPQQGNPSAGKETKAVETSAETVIETESLMETTGAEE